MSNTEPYLEHIESKEIRKLVHRLYQDQPDQSLKKQDITSSTQEQNEPLSPNQTSHDKIASEIDQLLNANNSLDRHAEAVETPLPEFPATEKPKKIKRPERPEKRKGIFGFFKK